MKVIGYISALLMALGVIFLICCSPHSDTDREFDPADREGLARKSLRMVKASHDRGSKPCADSLINADSLIRNAAALFRDRGDTLEMQSFFYYGCLMSSRARPDTALVLLTKACNLADRLGDHLYAAMSANELCRIYGELMIPEKKLEYAVMAREGFEKAGMPSRTADADISMIDALIWLGRYDEARAECRAFEKDHASDDPYWQRRLIGVRSVLSHKTDSLRQARNLLEYLRDSRMGLASNQWSRLGYYYLQDGDFKGASDALDSARTCLENKSDTLFVGLLDALISGESGHYKDGYEKALQWGYDIMGDGDERIANPKTLLLNDYFNLAAQNERLQKEKAQTRNLTLMAGCVMLIVIILLITVYYRSRMQLNKATTETLMNRVAALEKDISRHHSASDTLHNEIHLLFQDKLAMMNDMFKVWYRTGDSDDRTGQFRKGIINVLSQMQTHEALDEFIELINRHQDGWVTKFKATFPGLKERQYQLAVYMYLKFSNEAIAALMDKSSLNAVYVDKSKLKAQLSKSDSAEAARFISDLGFGV